MKYADRIIIENRVRSFKDILVLQYSFIAKELLTGVLQKKQYMESSPLKEQKSVDTTVLYSA